MPEDPCPRDAVTCPSTLTVAFVVAFAAVVVARVAPFERLKTSLLPAGVCSKETVSPARPEPEMFITPLPMSSVSPGLGAPEGDQLDARLGTFRPPPM